MPVSFYICIAFAIIAPYLISSINPAIVVSKLKTGCDIREMGSGNPGLTNTLRTMGKTAALIVLAFDLFKGVISVWMTRGLYKILNPSIEGGLYQNQPLLILSFVAALASVLGHCYPVYYKFKGGKAVLVTFSTLLAIDYVAALGLLSLFIIIVVITRYVSLGSGIAGSLYPVGVYLSGTYLHGNARMIEVVPFASMIAVLLVVKHRDNIKRLMNKTEKKISFTKTK